MEHLIKIRNLLDLTILVLDIALTEKDFHMHKKALNIFVCKRKKVEFFTILILIRWS